MACVYCRRSHMICDDSRPCLRCIKRGIGHLCHDEPTPGRQRRKPGKGDGLLPAAPEAASILPQQPEIVGRFPGANFGPAPGPKNGNLALSKTLPFNEEPFFYSEHAGSEFSSLNDFLSMIDDPELVNGALDANNESLMAFLMPQDQTNSTTSLANLLPFSPPANLPFDPSMQNLLNLSQSQSKNPSRNISLLNLAQQNQQAQIQGQNVQNQGPQQSPNQGYYPEQGSARRKSSATGPDQPIISDSARDKFFLTAADPTTEISPEERLKQVIKAKLDAGLLQPYNYAKGYARLQSYMDNYMNQLSRQRILKPLSVFRPAFRAIARTLKDVDMVLVEESFERMLLDYDRVFTSMAIPACLWRRTGEIYRGNKEFASLVGVTTDDLKDGKLAIYELMSEESAVNFWEKYGAIAFDKGQKAVLTSCNLRTKDGFKRKSCCFSFTIRRDRYNIPSCIVGNFIPIDP